MPDFRYSNERKAPATDSSGSAAGRIMPHDLEVERAVLSSMLREPDSGIDVAIQALGTSPDVFYSHVHRLIYSALCELHSAGNSSTDLVSLANFLRKKEQLESIGGVSFLAELHDAVPTTVQLESWCGIVRDYGTLRRMIGVCSESLAKCYKPEGEISEILSSIEGDIFKVRESELKTEISELTSLLEQEFTALQKILDGEVEVGIKTGYSQLDEYTGGLKPGEMFVLAARPSIGKTSMALNIIRNIILSKLHPKKVAFFSLEMTESQIARRLLCTQAKVPESAFFNRTFKNSEMHRITKAVEELSEGFLLIDPTGGLSIDELRAKARLMKMQHNIDLIVIDYLQLMRGRSRDNRQQEVAEISGGIKALAKELKIPVLVLAQLNREVEKTAGASTRPKLSHLRESGSIEQDADVVAFLHRNRDESKNKSGAESTPAWLIVEKNRNGQTGELNMHFFPAWMEFVPASPVDPGDAAVPVKKS